MVALVTRLVLVTRVASAIRWQVPQQVLHRPWLVLPKFPSRPHGLVALGHTHDHGHVGILVSDLVRNMWQYADGNSDLSSGFTKAVAGILGK